jgi:transcriptional antiterminator NusG
MTTQTDQSFSNSETLAVGTPAVDQVVAAAAPRDAGRWYVVHVYSGFEKKVAEAILHQAEQKGLSNKIFEVFVPTEEVVEVKRGKKVSAERRFFPGYVLVRMEMTDDSWHLVRNVPRVTGFIGAKNKPVPISAAEAAQIMKQVTDGVAKPRPAVIFEVGEQVRVNEGPFTSFTGLVEEVDEDKGRLKITVSIFGRPTPVELEFGQVEKL